MKIKTDDLKIESIKAVTSPSVICEEISITEIAAKTTIETRKAIHNILHGKDKRLIVISGPCSIHDVQAAKEYATKFKSLIDIYSDDLLMIMRVYFEKPRTTVGWKGLINDPDLDDSFNINKGLRVITPQYVTDLISWGAIGARTTESQCHRELSSGLSCPVGFKNGTNGTTKIAVDAIGSAIRPHNFLSLRKEGNAAIFSTTGNPDCHIILRGGKEPNYDADSINKVSKELETANLPANIMIDLSHANSRKKYDAQTQVGEDVAKQISGGDARIIGTMIESHLVAGRQDVTPNKELVYGQSITDACLGWENSTKLIETLAVASKNRRNS
jgi:3-deoxy-7-phosphoheptulonate synthase